MLFFIKLFFKQLIQPEAEIVGHFDKQATTYVIWRTPDGDIFAEKVQELTKRKRFLQKFSSKDAFLLGYLLGSEHEKII